MDWRGAGFPEAKIIRCSARMPRVCVQIKHADETHQPVNELFLPIRWCLAYSRASGWPTPTRYFFNVRCRDARSRCSIPLLQRGGRGRNRSRRLFGAPLPLATISALRQQFRSTVRRCRPCRWGGGAQRAPTGKGNVGGGCSRGAPPTSMPKSIVRSMADATTNAESAPEPLEELVGGKPDAVGSASTQAQGRIGRPSCGNWMLTRFISSVRPGLQDILSG